MIVLFIEFLNRDRESQYRSALFPFVRGHLEARGVPVHWVAYGFDPAALPGGRFRMSLAPDERATLLATVREVAPTHVLLNEVLDDELAGALREAAGRARIDVYDVAGGPVFRYVAALDAWLDGRPLDYDPDVTGGRLLVDEATPSFACTLANPLARHVKPFVSILGGPSCLYHAPLERNPVFEGVDLTQAERRTGCSFCGIFGDQRYGCETPPVALALAQLRAARATCPPERNAGEYRIEGAAAFMRLHEVLAAVLDEGFPPSAFYVSSRIDELLRKAPRLEPLLPRLAAAGHSLHIDNMGVENFSPAENQRLNKGITPEQVEAVRALLARWERAYPGTFRFQAHGGFGYILFTPWTTADDLRTNLAWAERLGIEATSFFFVSRVQLLPRRPLTLLAEHDGLLADRFDEATVAAFDSGCIVSPDVRERPWRFRVPAIAAVYGLFTRYRQAMSRAAGAPLPPGDALAALLAALPEEGRAPSHVLAAAVEAADAHPDVRTAEALVGHVAARLADRLADAAPKTPDLPRASEAPEATERRRLEAEVRDVLTRLAAHPKGLLRGFTVARLASEATGRGWGELQLELRRGDERLLLFVLPRGARPKAYLSSERFAIAHDNATPANTREKEHLIDLVLRAIERGTRAIAGAR